MKIVQRICLGLLAANALADDVALDIVGRHQAVFTSPPKKVPSDCSTDAPLLGNGDTLVALGGDAGALRFHIGKNELWRMNHTEGTHPVALARLDLTMPGMKGASYRVEQDLATAITTGTFTKGNLKLTLETAVAATENLLWVKLSATGGEIGGTARLLLPAQSSGAALLRDHARPAQIGREQQGGGRWYFDGQIADVRISPEVLSGTPPEKPVNPQHFDGRKVWHEFPAPTMEKSVSASAWINIRSADPQANYIVSKGDWNHSYSLGLSNGRLRWSIGGDFVQTADPLPTNEWLYVVGSFDGRAQRLYINGKRVIGPPEKQAPKDDPRLQVVERRFDVGDTFVNRNTTYPIAIPAGAACAMRVLDADDHFTITPGKPVWIVATVAGRYDPTPTPTPSQEGNIGLGTPLPGGAGGGFRERAMQRAANFQMRDLPALQQAHTQWWRNFWSKSFVEIPDQQLEQRYYLSHYGMAISSRVPDFPPGLFGWVTTDNPMWRGDYHMNYNFVSPFYGLYAANHPEQAAPCNEPILATHEQSLKDSLKYTEVEGTFHTVGIGPIGSYAFQKGHGQKSNSSYSCVPLGFYWYATYNLDFARRAYPFVRDTALFWENWLKFEPTSPNDGLQRPGNGRYVLYGCSAHEGSGNDMNGIVTLGLIRMVLNLALDMSTELGVDANRHEKWKHIRDHISAFPTQQSKDGKTIFRYTEKGIAWYNSNTIGIQHIYPAGGIGLDSDPKLLEISRNTINALNRWVDFNGMNSFYAAAARVGYDPNVILKQMRAMLQKIGGPNGMITGNPHGIENFSIVPNAIQEMLMQSHEGVIRLFPVWPREQDARFGTLRARGAFLVSAELKNGVVTGVRIVSEKGRDCTILNPWTGKRQTFKTKPGEVIELRAE